MSRSKPNKPSKERVQGRVPTGARGLVFGTIELPTEVEEDGTGYRPVALMFLDAASGFVFQPQLVRTVTADGVAGAWRDVLAQHAQRGLAAPRRVKTAEEALAVMLRAAGGDALVVEVGPTPELAEVRDGMAELAEGGAPLSYFHGQSFPSGLLRAFFTAALAYRKAQPWLQLVAEDFIEMDIPALGVTGAGVSVITDEGHGGLQIFRDCEGALADLSASEGQVPHADTRAVMFFTRRQLPPQLRGELRRLPFAPATGTIPATVALDDLGRSRPLVRRDYQIAIAALTAVTRFFAEHGAAIDAGEEALLRGEYELDSDGERVVVRLQLDLGEADGDEFADEAPGQGIAGAGPRPSANSRHRLKVLLQDSRPPIWRRIEVPSTLTLAELHTVLQIAMGWDDEHLYGFRHKGRNIGPDLEFDDRATELWALVPAVRGKLRYEYDFGDSWIHDIEVEAVELADEPLAAPRCLDGRRAGPPEDCGGIHGLHRLLHGGRDEEEDFIYDPTKFSVDAVNRQLRAAFAARPPAKSRGSSVETSR